MKTFLTTLSALAIAVPAFAEEKEIAMDEAPEAAVATAEANSGGRDFEAVLYQVEDGVEMYEFIGTKDDGLGFGVEVLPDGTLLETAETITMDEVPEAVMATFTAELPGFEPEQIERNIRDGGALVVYEFEGEIDGALVEAEIHEDGSNFANVAEEES